MVSRSLVLLLALPATVLVSLAIGRAPAGADALPSSPAPAAPAPTPAPAAPIVSSSGGLTVTVTPDRSKVSTTSEGLVRVRVDLRGEASGAVARPSDIVVALDTSGSMSGDKIATARASVQALIDAMGPEDRLAVVAFSSGSQALSPYRSAAELTPMTADAREAWFRTVAALDAGGGTDMVSGLGEAVRIAEAVEGRSTRVLLVTDGQPDTEVGLHGLALEAARTGTPLTTVGIGEGYNETLLSALADDGTGNFFWARPGLDLAEVFDAELHDAGTAVASQARLRLAGGARLVEASGLPVVQGGDAQLVNLGSVLAGRTRTIWLTLQVPTNRLGAVDLGAITVDWQGLAGPAEARATLGTVGVVADQAEALASLDVATWEAGVVADEWNDCKQDVAKLTQAGDKAGALQRLATYKSKIGLENRVANSKVVTDNLAQVGAYEQDMAAQYEGPDAAEKRNVWSKIQSATSYGSRRGGQSSRF